MDNSEIRLLRARQDLKKMHSRLTGRIAELKAIIDKLRADNLALRQAFNETNHKEKSK